MLGDVNVCTDNIEKKDIIIYLSLLKIGENGNKVAHIRECISHIVKILTDNNVVLCSFPCFGILRVIVPIRSGESTGVL